MPVPLKSKSRRVREEGCGEEGPLRSIFFAEFHPTLGPIVRCQAPRKDEVISKDVFDDISVFIIPKAELVRRTITVNVKGYKVMGYPIVLQDKKYKRNEFMFNVCFVCHPWSRSAQFEPALVRLSEFFVNLEHDAEFLSNEANNAELLDILEKILQDLNSKDKTDIEVQGFSYKARVVHQKPDPRTIGDHEVPVLMADVEEKPFDWDLTTQQILPYMNGLNHVAKIAQLAGVHTGLVKACVQNLRYYHIVRMAPIFQFGNDYCTTLKLTSLLNDKTLQAAMMDNCVLDGYDSPEFGAVYKFVSDLRHGTPLKDICVRHKVGRGLNVDVYKLIQFLCVHGVIRRLHKKPYYEAPEHPDVIAGSAGSNGFNYSLRKRLLALCDGTKTMDEICVATTLSTQELMEFCDSEQNIYLL